MTNYAASFGAKKCSETTFEAAEVMLSPPCSVKSFENLKLFFVSLDSPLVALERDIFKLTKGCLMSEKIEHK